MRGIRDLYLAAFLIGQGFSVERIDATGIPAAVYFAPAEGLESSIQAYHRGASMSAKQLRDRHRQLTRQVRGQRDGNTTSAAQ